MTVLRAEGCGIALSGDEYKASVTGFTFCVIWHEKHSADWLAALASPYPAAPDFPLFRGKNKTPRDNLLINPPLEMTVATGTPIVISTEAKRSGEISLHHGS